MYLLVGHGVVSEGTQGALLSRHISAVKRRFRAALAHSQLTCSVRPLGETVKFKLFITAIRNVEVLGRLATLL